MPPQKDSQAAWTTHAAPFYSRTAGLDLYIRGPVTDKVSVEAVSDISVWHAGAGGGAGCLDQRIHPHHFHCNHHHHHDHHRHHLQLLLGQEYSYPPQ
ncbi:hypothetical protein E2C01_033762 [Portunus trituberculatus]|uniref:Uncharacterized protein n=1 Tax=Portunus trituberculatus TaxID=210409 RepID=A0A5B7F4A6_PORTR|nr:hypothetical protein [Portunus trituberculatus]